MSSREALPAENGKADFKFRMPPHSIPLEQGVLGALMIDNSLMHVIAQVLTVTDFYRDSHQVIYGTIKRRYEANKGFDLHLVCEDLERSGELAGIGGSHYLYEIVSGEGALTWHALEYAAIVKDKSIKRQLIVAANRLLHESYAEAHDSQVVLGMTGRDLLEIQHQMTGSSLKTGEQVTEEAIKYIDRRLAGEVTGIMTGFTDIDDATDGFQDGEMIVLAARPSQGKSALGMNIAENVALQGGVTTLFISLEMKSRSLGLRLLASNSQIDSKLFRKPDSLSADQFSAIDQAHAFVSSGRLWIDDKGGRTVDQIAAQCRSLKMTENLGFVVLDYLGRVQPSYRRDENRTAEVGRISTAISDLAKELNIPFLILHQLNRASENRDDRRPRISDLRDSGVIEQDADVVMLLHRACVYNPEDRPGEADVNIVKNRNGEPRPVRLAFLKHLTKFGNLAYSGTDYSGDWS